MRLVEPWIKVENFDGVKIMKRIERACRTCYRSEDKISEESYKNLLTNCLNRGHESVLEHEKITVRIYSDIGTYKDLTRHRFASFSVESTRYCSYNKDKYGNEIAVVNPVYIEDKEVFETWKKAIEDMEKAYMKMKELGASTDMCREILPHSTAAEYTMTANIREWKHILELRTTNHVHPAIRQVLIPLLLLFKEQMPEIFGDIEYDKEFNPKYYAKLTMEEELARKIREELKLKVDKLKENGIVPKLAVILVGDDSASKVYVKNKSKACQDVGVEFEEILLDENTSMERLLEIIEKLNNREDINGILLQSPIPKGLNIQEAFEKIHCKKDVDGFNPVNVGKLMIGEDTFISCTPYGIIKMLEAYNIEIEGKHAVVIGRSNIVGKPLAQCLLQKNATVTICHSKTKNIAEITKTADILISAVGKTNMVTADMVKDGAVVIDVGMNRNEAGKLVGDVDFENVKQKVSYITPVPGGVGPMTIAMLMNNVIKATEEQTRK